MNTLHNLQEQFAAAILGNNGQDDYDTNVNPESPFSIEQAIVASSLSGKRRLNIYRNNVNISLREALKSIYPVTHRLVGDDFFKVLAQQYTKKYPSLSGNLHDFGNHLPEFIENNPAASELVYLADVAKLEWAYHAVFHAADVTAFDIDKLQKIDTSDYGRLVFRLNPASKLLHSNYPILKIWETNQITEDLAAQNQATISLDEGGTRLLVVRKEIDIEFHPLDSAEFCFLTALSEGKNFFSACDAACHAHADRDVGELLQKFILSQAIVDFEIENNPSLTGT